MSIVGIDPGTEYSALLAFDPTSRAVLIFEYSRNEDLRSKLRLWANRHLDVLAIETMSFQARSTGRETFETCYWIGKFLEAWEAKCGRSVEIERNTLRKQIAGDACANDSVLRAALIDRFGPGKERAIGGKKCPKCKGKGWFGAGRPTCPVCTGSTWKTPPGPLYGVSKHVWSALAVAVAYAENGAK